MFPQSGSEEVKTEMEEEGESEKKTVRGMSEKKNDKRQSLLELGGGSKGTQYHPICFYRAFS